LHDGHRLGGRVLEPVQLGFLRIGRIDGILNLFDRQIRKPLLGLLARIRRLGCLARLGIHCRVLWPELIEAFFLLVAERVVELLQYRPHRLHRLQRCIEPRCHCRETAWRCQRERIFRRT
jgi:hypothetical protein